MYRQDIHREFFMRLDGQGQGRLSGHGPRVHPETVAEVQSFADSVTAEYLEGNRSTLRTAAMNTAVKAMMLLYEIDDALS